MAENKTIENVVIIGGGPAGLAAAIYTARANLNPVVFAGSPPGGQLTLTTEVENFPGHLSIMGPELVNKMREQAIHFNTRVLDQNIKEIKIGNSPFEIIPAQANAVPTYTKSLIIATGAKALWLDLPSEQRLRGKGVSACATCDGFFFRNKTVAIIGGGDTAMEEALTLTRFASKVYVFHRRNEFRASKIMQDRVKNHEKIEIIWNAQIMEVIGEEKVTGVRYKDIVTGKESDVVLEGIFLAIGHKPDTEIFKDHVAVDSKGYILNSQYYALKMLGKNPDTSLASKFDPFYTTMTTVPGVFAAGDCVDFTYRQATTAAGMGVAASLDAERWLELQNA